ncbi:MAG: hypothetical protein WCH99_19240 [Verrucomicrobiota bacterium]
MKLTNPTLKAATLCAAMLAWSFGTAAGQPSAPWAPNPPKMPDWLTELSLGAKESYDDNVLLVAGKTTPLNPAAMSRQDSWVTTLSPTIGMNFAPADGKTLQALSLVYAPDFVFLHEMPAVNYNAHKIGGKIKGQTGNFSYSWDNDFLFNDGSSTAPTYGLGSSADQGDRCGSAFASAMVRDRVKQIQERATVALKYDTDRFFIRPTATLLMYDFMTDWHANASGLHTGYQNYTDRTDVNGGADLGWKVTSGMAVTLGYRYGHQYQQAFTPAIYNIEVNHHPMQSSSDYQRVLLGAEGKPWKWLTVKLAGGPDFRAYNPAAPVDDNHPTTYFAEAGLTATLTANQTLTFNYKQWQWVSSVGRVPYFDSTYALNYHWKASEKLGLDLGGRFLEYDYSAGSATLSHNSSLRDDALYTVSAGVSYAFTAHFTASLGYACDLGRNLESGLPASLYPEYREFNRQTISLSAKYKF